MPAKEQPCVLPYTQQGASSCKIPPPHSDCRSAEMTHAQAKDRSAGAIAWQLAIGLFKRQGDGPLKGLRGAS